MCIFTQIKCFWGQPRFKANKQNQCQPSNVMAFPALSFDLAICSSEAMVADDHSSL